jgi:tetratricopeptide (TPR) repeat protein
MGFRVYKSFKVAKGVRLNVSKTGMGVSVGVPGLRKSVHSSGRTTTTVGAPGTGVYYRKDGMAGTGSRSRSSSSRSRPPAQAPVAPPPKPSLFAPKGEKRLYQAVMLQKSPDAIAKVGAEFPAQRLVAYSVAGFMVAGRDTEEAATLLTGAFELGLDVAEDPFTRKYLGGMSRMEVGIAPGVVAELPICRDGVGLLLAEIHQERGEPEKAIDIVEQLEPSAYAALSLAELYVQVKRWADVIEVTGKVTNEDDLTALLLVYRGVALRELGQHGASLEALKEALRARSRAREVRHLALSERSRTHEAAGDKKKARNDLEKILAEDSTFEGVAERLSSLQG